MRFGLLGPIEVRQDGRPLPVGRGREGVVLAALILGAGRVSTAGRLVDVLWDEPPRTATAQLHNMISRLRRRLPAGLIVSRDGGYELRLDDHELDLAEFRQLVERGRRAADGGDHQLAADLLAEAQSLWRGPALADVPGEFAAATRQALHAERLSAAETRLAAELALDRNADVLREVAALIEEEPYRERLHEIRITALAAAGRRADALAAYRELYRRLGADLGVAPGSALQRLEARILRGDHLGAPPEPGHPTPRQLPPAAPLVAGRAEVVDDVCTRLRAGAVLVLTGTGGIGKTTVALTAAHRADDAFPDGQLYADLRGSGARPADPHDVAGRFLRALGVDGREVPDDPGERVARYRAEVTRRRVLVVLDDAADEAQVRQLLPDRAAVVTSRRRLGGLAAATRLELPLLAPLAANTLIAAVIGAERAGTDPAAAADIAGLCGHLPLAVCVAAARLAVHPEWTLDEFRQRLAEERRRLDELAVGDLDVRASIALSYQALRAPLRLLLRRLGLLMAPDWPAWVADELAGTPAAGLLNELVDIHLVEPLGGDALGQARFRLHDLVADFARERAFAEDPAEDRTAALARLLSGWLALATAADTELDHGMMVTAGLAPPSRPPPAAAVTDAPGVWFDTERGSLVHAVEQACAAGEADLAGRLALRLSGFLAVRSYDDDREHTLRQALACAAGQHHRAPLLGALFAVLAQRDRYAELPAIAAAELAAARQDGDPRAEFMALTHAGRAARMLDRYAEAAGWLEQAMTVARHAEPAPELMARTLHSYARMHADLGRPEPALPLLAESIALERKAGGGRSLAIHLHSYGLRLMEAGHLADAERVLGEAHTAARTLDDARGTAWVEHALADLDIRLGRFADAAARLDRSLAAQEKVGDQEGTAEVLRSAGDLEAARGDPARAAELLRRSLATWRRLGSRLEQARTLARLGRVLGDDAEAAACHRECQQILAALQLTEASLGLAR